MALPTLWQNVTKRNLCAKDQYTRDRIADGSAWKSVTRMTWLPTSGQNNWLGPLTLNTQTKYYPHRRVDCKRLDRSRSRCARHATIKGSMIDICKVLYTTRVEIHCKYCYSNHVNTRHLQTSHLHLTGIELDNSHAVKFALVHTSLYHKKVHTCRTAILLIIHSSHETPYYHNNKESTLVYPFHETVSSIHWPWTDSCLSTNLKLFHHHQPSIFLSSQYKTI